jgi:hypothetical protein
MGVENSVLPTDELANWHEFYTLTGTAAATFIALLFVAVSVGAGIWERRAATRAFLTATVVHFSSILFVSLIDLAPLRQKLLSGALVILVALIGAAYCGLVLRDLLRDGLAATIDWEDRTWYAALPVVGYALMAISGILLAAEIEPGSAVLALAIVLLLITGIRNAWDITVWLVTRRRD